jgi:hypothetical protein
LNASQPRPSSPAIWSSPAARCRAWWPSPTSPQAQDRWLATFADPDGNYFQLGAQMTEAAPEQA